MPKKCCLKFSKAGTQTIRAFLDNFKAANAHKKSIHLVGHSTGGVLLAHFLEAFRKLGPNQPIGTCSLLAPACTMALFNSHYQPCLGATSGKFGIKKMTIYNLTDELERDDQVAQIYRKSLLYLVCNAFEETQGEAILGMQKFSKEMKNTSVLETVYSNGQTGGATKTASETHGGFDNDPYTMNDILRNVLGRNPGRPFTEEDLKY